jgi:TPR repeat protein
MNKEIERLHEEAKAILKTSPGEEAEGLLFKIYLKAAKLGDAQGQACLAYAYDKGEGVRRSPSKAIYWYEKAARQGEPVAAYNYAQLLLNGKKPNRSKALRLLKVSAKGGFPNAMTNLGVHYQDRNEFQKAVHYHRLAHAKKDGLGTFNLARCYWFGFGVRQNRTLAQRLFKSAVKRLKLIEEKDSGEWEVLHEAYDEGWGVRKNRMLSDGYEAFADMARRGEKQLLSKFRFKNVRARV